MTLPVIFNANKPIELSHRLEVMTLIASMNETEKSLLNSIHTHAYLCVATAKNAIQHELQALITSLFLCLAHLKYLMTLDGYSQQEIRLVLS